MLSCPIVVIIKNKSSYVYVAISAGSKCLRFLSSTLAFVGNRYVIETDGLLIKKVDYNDAGTYTCRARVLETGSLEERDIKLEVMKINCGNVNVQCSGKYLAKIAKNVIFLAKNSQKNF